MTLPAALARRLGSASLDNSSAAPLRDAARLRLRNWHDSAVVGHAALLGLSAVDEGMRLVQEAGIDRIRAEGIALNEFAIRLVDAHLAEGVASVASLRDPAQRGAHVTLASRCQAALRRADRKRVIPEFRRPDVIRFGMSPLTTPVVDVWDGVRCMRCSKWPMPYRIL